MRTPNYNFEDDLPIAKKTEAQITDFLVGKGLKFLEDCDDNRYDVKMGLGEGDDFKEVTIEIKEDFTCERTGNVGVEVESWGRPSGLSVSKADFYLYKVHEPNGRKSMYMIKTTKLKKMVKDCLWFREVVGGDPGSDSRNFLFKLNVVKENFSFLGTLPW
jgi:hypothetical protein